MLKTHKPLWILFIIFIIPVIASGLLFQFHNYFRLKTLNHGTLITPPIHVKYLSSEQKKWRVIYVADEKCGSQCAQIYHQLQQVKKALGKESDRVTTMMLNPNDPKFQPLQQTVNHIYLADPLGNVFMYYSADANPMNVLKDLQRVLEVSQIG